MEKTRNRTRRKETTTSVEEKKRRQSILRKLGLKWLIVFWEVDDYLFPPLKLSPVERDKFRKYAFIIDCLLNSDLCEETEDEIYKEARRETDEEFELVDERYDKNWYTSVVQLLESQYSWAILVSGTGPFGIYFIVLLDKEAFGEKHVRELYNILLKVLKIDSLTWRKLKERVISIYSLIELTVNYVESLLTGKKSELVFFIEFHP